MSTAKKLRLGPLPKTENVKLTFACPASLKTDLDRFAIRLRVQRSVWRSGRCDDIDSAHAGGVHGRGSGIQEGKREQGRTAEVGLTIRAYPPSAHQESAAHWLRFRF